MAQQEKPVTEEKPAEEATVAGQEQHESQDEQNEQETAAEAQPEAQSAEDVLKQQLEEAENRYLRLQADFQNFRRRASLDLEAKEKYRAQSLVTELLPVLDNFERALQVTAASDETKSVLQGMDMVYKALVAALQSEGVEPVETVGKPFDPTVHQAVMTDSDDSAEPNTVLAELQKGYTLKDRIIRPAMVKVNQ